MDKLCRWFKKSTTYFSIIFISVVQQPQFGNILSCFESGVRGVELKVASNISFNKPLLQRVNLQKVVFEVADEITEENRLMCWLNGILIWSQQSIQLKNYTFSKYCIMWKARKVFRGFDYMFCKSYIRMLFGKRIVFTVVNVYITSENLYDKSGIIPPQCAWSALPSFI